MLGDGGGDQPPSSHALGGCLITDILQAWPEDWITKAVVLLQGRPSCSLAGAPGMKMLSFV